MAVRCFLSRSDETTKQKIKPENNSEDCQSTLVATLLHKYCDRSLAFHNHVIEEKPMEQDPSRMCALQFNDEDSGQRKMHLFLCDIIIL